GARPARAQNCQGSTAFLNCVIALHQSGKFTIPSDLTLPKDLPGRAVPPIGQLFSDFQGPTLPALRQSGSRRRGNDGGDQGHHHGGGNSGQGVGNQGGISVGGDQGHHHGGGNSGQGVGNQDGISIGGDQGHHHGGG